ncbi:hypothetical protein ID866_1876 [Astraeus odoratus]|nr:hypothetical protein ID866_1876 [Astraeus odoratus]
MLDFIEQGNYAPLWYVQHEASFDPADVRNQEKAFDDCKAAVIKAVVEMAGEDKNVDVLIDTSDQTKPGGAFISRMVNWIRTFVAGGKYGNTRDDLVICASLSLGNVMRREVHSTVLLSPPYNIAQLLSSEVLLSPSTDIKLKHGVIGLLKHLSQSSSNSPTNRAALSRAGVIERILFSGIWDERSDAMADVVQMNAIGVVKHLCNGSLDNSFKVLLPIDVDNPPPTGLAQILSLVKRSDKVAIKSEGTRVIVNLVKSIWSSDPARRSLKYPILVNEAVVALSLLSTQREGGPLVLRAVVSPLPIEATARVPSSVAMSTTPSVCSETASPVSSPAMQHRSPQRRALDQLVLVLRNSSDGSTSPHSALPSCPVEVRVNICSLLGQLSKQPSGEHLDIVKEVTRPVLEDLSGNNQGLGRENMLGHAAKRVLDLWAQE